MRKQGILLPVSSLPSPYGIGTFGKAAYEFVDFLAAAGQSLWQILPLGPTGYGDSPYQSFSTFAGNPYYIDLDFLVADGYLTKEDCDACDFGDDSTQIDYEKIYLYRFGILWIAYSNAKTSFRHRKDFRAFYKENAWWLEDYALYMAVKGKFDNACFLEWEEDIRLRKPAALKAYKKELSEEVDFYIFQQYLFARQWKALKAYANEKGIEIVGDIPIYVAFDSADTWANPKLFQLDANGYPTGVAGCPPDCFSETGQLWGNPLYDWPYHKETGYDWWMKRIAYCYTLYDVLRIDHFRGFESYWNVPYGDETAVGGKWEKGPGFAFFATMKKTLGERAVIAEDLGFLTPAVIKMVKRTGYPGMKILQFAFDAYQNSEYLPYNYDKNCVVYTGTHDNETTAAFIEHMPKKDRRFAKKYLGVKKKKDLCRAFIVAALSSAADTAIIPMQDYLELGSFARINTPSTLGCNWQWRMESDALDADLAEELYHYGRLYNRIPQT